MNAKEFFAKLHWGRSVPVLLSLAAAIAVLAVPTGESLARSVTVGVLFSLSGIVCLLAFLLDREENPVRLLAGVARISSAVWMLVTLTTPVHVFCIAMGIVVLLSAGADCFEAIRGDVGIKRVLRLVFDALLLALSVTLFCDPFKSDALLYFAGSAMFCEAVYSGVLLFLERILEEAPAPRTGNGRRASK